MMTKLLLISFIFLTSVMTLAQTWNVPATQDQRSAERFDIISWIRGTQSIIARQNSKYGYGGSSKRGPTLDIVLQGYEDSGTITRNSTLGNDTRITGKAQILLDDLFTRGDRKASFNIDLGGEVFSSQTTSFAVASGVSQTAHNYIETGGGLVIRPFGRSSQDTGLLVKGGYLNITESGLWSNTTTQYLLYAPYLGAEAKLYLLPFLGVYGDYQATLPTTVGSLQGQWNMQRFRYGGFVEIFLVQVSAYISNTQMTLTPNSGSAINENYLGYGVGGALFF
jgi:hypothetical protein